MKNNTIQGVKKGNKLLDSPNVSDYATPEMGFASSAKEAWGHIKRFLRSVSGWKYSNWIIAVLLGLAALMATLNNFGWALIFMIASGIFAGASCWKSKAVQKRFKVGNKYQYRPVLGLRILSTVAITVLWGIPSYYLAKKTNSKPPSLPAPPVEMPTVEVKYSPESLPFSIQPSTSVLLLRTNRKLLYWPEEISNPPYAQYPPKYKPPTLSQTFSNLYICSFDNHSDKDLIDVRVSFHISFR